MTRWGWFVLIGLWLLFVLVALVLLMPTMVEAG